MSSAKVDALSHQVRELQKQFRQIADAHAMLKSEHQALYVRHAALLACLEQRGNVLPEEINILVKKPDFLAKHAEDKDVKALSDLPRDALQSISAFAGFLVLQSLKAAACDYRSALEDILPSPTSFNVYLLGGLSTSPWRRYTQKWEWAPQWRFEYPITGDNIDVTCFSTSAQVWSTVRVASNPLSDSPSFFTPNEGAHVPVFMKEGTDGFIFFTQSKGWHWFDCRSLSWIAFAAMDTTAGNLDESIVTALMLGSWLYVAFLNLQGLIISRSTASSGKWDNLPCPPVGTLDLRSVRLELIDLGGELHLWLQHPLIPQLHGTQSSTPRTCTWMRYDQEADMWKVLPPLVMATHTQDTGAQLGICRNGLHVVQSDSTYRFNSEKQTWEPCLPMPASRVCFKIVCSSRFLYVLGGLCKNTQTGSVPKHYNTCAADIARFDSRANTWEILPLPPTQPLGAPVDRGTYQFTTTALGNALYVFNVACVYGDTGPQCWVHCEGQWQALPIQPRTVRGALCVKMPW
mmetsp:Transcript_79581/g.150236  ORF Transcript_79581/g.150236 Transcript_79581/m.150236 type:complete len:518 (-) Transcript_79581:489-2042(-)